VNSKGHGNHHQHPHELVYYLPGQVILHLTHAADLTSEILTRELAAFLNDKNAHQPWKNELKPPGPESVLTFPIQREGVVNSFIPTHLENEDGDPEDGDPGDVSRLINTIYGSSGGQPWHISNVDDIPITLVSVSPNWLAGGVAHGIGVVGPGAWPTPADVKAGSWPQFSLGNKKLETNSGGGGGLHIAILDTAPCLHEIVAAYEKWRKPKDAHSQPHLDSSNRLIESLLHPDGPLRPDRPLHVYPATLDDLRLVAPYTSLGHPYSMPDHGLFVAGIIHTFVPQATLHLYEVMNSYGVGCVETLLKGLIHALKQPDHQRPQIINCSLVLGLPSDGQPDPDFPYEFPDPTHLEKMLKPLEDIFDLIADEGIVVVAAAGNDAQDGHQRPPARYPAALQSVIGVGALPRPPHGTPHKKASYSNLADNPIDKGYVTLGGEEGEEQGVLGVYISPLPRYNDTFPNNKREFKRDRVEYDNNKSGWAWWAGTSFAAPIISGILARNWDTAAPTGLAGARSTLDGLSGGTTPVNKAKVIHVDQDPS
jgi:hypothetical protein